VELCLNIYDSDLNKNYMRKVIAAINMTL